MEGLKFEQQQALAVYLSQFVTSERLQLIDRLYAQRTRYLTVMLEDIYQSQNASAVMRTCDCLGIQDLYIVENRNEYTINPLVVRGSDQWTTQYRFNQPAHDNTTDAILALKKKGYRVVATCLHHRSCSLNEFDIAKGKFAFVFGNECNGISPVVADLADEFVTIPMYGFTESFNISVAAGICLHTLSTQVRQSDLSWRLTPEEQVAVRIDWLMHSIRMPEMIVADFCRKMGYSAEK